MTDIFLRGL